MKRYVIQRRSLAGRLAGVVLVVLVLAATLLPGCADPPASRARTRRFLEVEDAESREPDEIRRKGLER